MSSLITRIFILGLCAALAAVSGFYNMWILSHYFIGVMGLFLGIIGMKEKARMADFARSIGFEIDMGDLEDAAEKTEVRSKQKKKKKL